MAYVIGTAGHVDHGKTSLVTALTGTNTDRLKEEQERGLTIDLGFTFIDLPQSGRTGIVDVPGHRDFIQNMLAGVGGIDLALLVIAADEGIMPQTREHLSILHLLRVERIVVALSKIDLVEDNDWVELVTLDVIDLLEGFGFTEVPVVAVSAVTHVGLDQLIDELDEALQAQTLGHTRSITRLPVDRVFSIDGFGTVATGTLLGGPLTVGQTVELQPSNLEARIRGIQNHGQPLEIAQPGNRIAVNLSGIDKNDITRGDVLLEPGALSSSRRLDVLFEHLPDDQLVLVHNTELKFFSGSTEAMARVRIIGDREVAAGQTGWLQLELSEPVAVANGDRYILRRPSPATTIGGGQILDAHPPYQWRRFREETLAHFELLTQGSPEVLLLAELNRLKVIQRSKLQADDDLLSELIAEEQILVLPSDYLATSDTMLQLEEQVGNILEGYHQAYPLYAGLSREDLRNRLGLNKAEFAAVLEQLAVTEVVTTNEGWVFLPTHEIRFDENQKRTVERLLADLQQGAFQTPSFDEIEKDIGEDLLQALLIRGDVIQVKNRIVFHADVYNQAVSQVIEHINSTGSLTVADARDLFVTSRKYVLGLLEHLDEVGITRREENYRVLR